MGTIGSAQMDVHSQFGKSHDNIQPVFEYGGLNKLGKEDPRTMDKLVFDRLIGNTDRHSNNMLVGQNKETGKHEMLGIDHGFTFPNNNKVFNKVSNGKTDGTTGKYVDRHTQQAFETEFNKGKVSNEFAKKMIAFKQDGSMQKYVNELAKNVGKSEAVEFIARFNKELNSIVSKKKQGQKAK